MKVTLIGFSVDSENEYVTVPYFFRNLAKTKNARKLQYGHCARYFFLNDDYNENYYLGMIITVKDQKSYLKFSEALNGYIIKRENLHGKEKLLEFNFFAISKDSKKGIYTHYHQSCAIRELNSIFRGYFYDLRDGLKRKAHKESVDKGVRAKFKKLVRSIDRKFKGRFLFSTIVRQEDLKEILEKLKRIKNVEVVVDAIQPSPARPGVPLADKSRRITERFTIGKGWTVDSLIADVIELSDMNGVQRGKVLGINDEDEDETVKFDKAIENFGSYEYDELTEKINNLHSNDFYKHSIFDDLIEVIESESNEDVFSADME